MAKTLVIKGASFGTNKVTAVSFAGNVPCTGIAITESSVSATDYDPITLTYEVTPSNTTDNISWTTSDSTVATVANGVIAPVGLGTATITATCGSYSDTVSVTVAIVYVKDYANKANTRLYTETSPYIVVTGGGNYRVTVCGTGEQESTYTTQEISGYTEKLHAVKIPVNATKVKVSRSADKAYVFDTGNDTIVWTKDESSGNTTFPGTIKPISDETFNLKNTAEHVFDIPSGVDSFFISIVLDSVSSDVDATLNGAGFTVEFLAS